MVVSLTTLFKDDRDIGRHLRGAFDSDALPEEWDVSSSPEENRETIKRTRGGNWRAVNPLVD